MREGMASPKTEAEVTRPRGIQEDLEHLLAGAAIKGAQAVARVRLGMILLLIYSRMHVVLSTCLAIATLSVTLLLNGTFSWVTASFAACCYISLAWLILQTNRFVLETVPELEQRRRLSRLLPPSLVDRVMHEGTGASSPSTR